MNREENISFCTIITADYAPYALVLHDSLCRFNKTFHFSVFLSKGGLSEAFEKEFLRRKYVQLYDFKDLQNFSYAKDLKDKYCEERHDAFRWGMKPVFINFLLESFEKVIYLDCDIYFFSDFHFLYEELNHVALLLTPHWRNSNPLVEYDNFKLNFLEGLYNAGFIGASRGAELALNWWAKMILFKCEVNTAEGFYDDQRYLDLLPVLFENTGILRHKGCNVANWNKILCNRTLNDNGEVTINNHFPIVFVHFTNSLLTGVFYKNDKLLSFHLEQYRDNLLKYSDVDIIEEFSKKVRFKKLWSEEDFTPERQTITIAKRIRSLVKKIYKKIS
ncbi:glycosyltransferase [Salinimicrobium flavum]|uniref:Glycosyltransferase n=1 Tax=Salinimicrobium flavum TaxID=1737065 RepID=A0ABW5IW99_9FLAO